MIGSEPARAKDRNRRLGRCTPQRPSKAPDYAIRVCGLELRPLDSKSLSWCNHFPVIDQAPTTPSMADVGCRQPWRASGVRMSLWNLRLEVHLIPFPLSGATKTVSVTKQRPSRAPGLGSTLSAYTTLETKSGQWHLRNEDPPLECHLNQVAFLDASSFGRRHLP